MEDNNIGYDITAALFIICVTVLIIFFQGDPDIHDAIIRYLMTQ